MNRILTFVALSALATVLSSTVVVNFLVENHVLKEVVFTLQEMDNDVYFAKLVDVPLLVCSGRVDFAVILSSYFEIICELRLGKAVFQFNLNKMSLDFYIEQGKLQLDGEVSKFGFASFKATVNTDGIIQGVPKLVLYYL